MRNILMRLLLLFNYSRFNLLSNINVYRASRPYSCVSQSFFDQFFNLFQFFSKIIKKMKLKLNEINTRFNKQGKKNLKN